MFKVKSLMMYISECFHLASEGITSCIATASLLFRQHYYFIDLHMIFFQIFYIFFSGNVASGFLVFICHESSFSFLSVIKTL